MNKQYQLNLTEQQLERLVELSKKGTMCRNDNHLINYLEYVLKNQGIEFNTTNSIGTLDLDEIPF